MQNQKEWIWRGPGFSGKSIVGPAKLDIGRIVAAGRRHRMHTTAGRAAIDKGPQRKGRTAPLAAGFKPSVGKQLVLFGAAVGAGDKIDQRFSFGEGTALSFMVAGAACTSAHGLYSCQGRVKDTSMLGKYF
jgi:hypothetical protein